MNSQKDSLWNAAKGFVDKIAAQLETSDKYVYKLLAELYTAELNRRRIIRALNCFNPDGVLEVRGDSDDFFSEVSGEIVAEPVRHCDLHKELNEAIGVCLAELSEEEQLTELRQARATIDRKICEITYLGASGQALK